MGERSRLFCESLFYGEAVLMSDGFEKINGRLDRMENLLTQLISTVSNLGTQIIEMKKEIDDRFDKLESRMDKLEFQMNDIGESVKYIGSKTFEHEIDIAKVNQRIWA